MKLKWKTMYWSMILVWFGCIPAFAEPFAEGPYLGQTPPGPIAKVFAPGLICDTRPHNWESHGHFSADGNTFCFNRRKYVYITENTDQGWTTPKYIESIPYKTWSPSLSPDANSIYFNYRYDRSKRWSLHRCMRTSQGWSLPRELGPTFSFATGGFSVAADNSIYFVTDRGRFWVAPFCGQHLGSGYKDPCGEGQLKRLSSGHCSGCVLYGILLHSTGSTERNGNGPVPDPATDGWYLDQTPEYGSSN